MTSSAIQKLLEEKNYLVTVDEYKEIIQSPQLVCISYRKETDDFKILTYDYKLWTFRVEGGRNR